MAERLTLNEIVAAFEHANLRRVESPWFDAVGAAEYIKSSPGTLKTWRAQGRGPRYHLIHGRTIRYRVDDLDAFVRGEVDR